MSEGQNKYIDDEIFMSPHYYSSEDKEISLMMCDDGNGMCGIGYREINRLTGKFRSLNISIPNKKVIAFLKNIQKCTRGRRQPGVPIQAPSASRPGIS